MAFSGLAQRESTILFDVGGNSYNNPKICQFKISGCDLYIWFDANKGIGVWDYLAKKNYYCTFDVK